MDFNMNFGIDTKIDAINQVLAAIGSVGINAEDEIDYNIDASMADKLLDAQSQNIQINRGKGWWFNREEFHKFAPDKITGNIVVPNNTLSAFVKRQPGGKILPVTLRGQKLFESKTLGYDMRSMVNSAGMVECILVMNLPFDELPAGAKQAITAAARFWIVAETEGDQVKMQPLQQSAMDALGNLGAEDASQKRRNMMNNGRVQYTVAMAGGLNNV